MLCSERAKVNAKANIFFDIYSYLSIFFAFAPTLAWCELALTARHNFRKIITTWGCSHQAKANTKAKKFFDGCNFSLTFYALAPPIVTFNTKRKRTRKQKFSMLFCHFYLIFFAFACAFARCEQFLRLLSELTDVTIFAGPTFLTFAHVVSDQIAALNGVHARGSLALVGV